MEDESCELCGFASQLGAVEKHHIVLIEVTGQAGMPKSQTIKLCCNCHREVHTWYSTKVIDKVYDPEVLRFRARSWLEMVKEYQAAFNSFVKYKKEHEKKQAERQQSHELQ